MATLGLVQRRTLEMAISNLNQLSSTWCSKAHSAARPQRMLMLIFNTFTIRGVTQDTVHLHLFPSSLLGKTKQSFYSNKEAVSTWEMCSNAFLDKFFLLGKTNFHHGMEEWFIIQSFYHGLIRSAREHIDAAVGGSFFIFSIEEAHKLVEMMASNQSWDEERTQTHTCKVH
jgi:hypothetical protein